MVVAAATMAAETRGPKPGQPSPPTLRCSAYKAMFRIRGACCNHVSRLLGEFLGEMTGRCAVLAVQVCWGTGACGWFLGFLFACNAHPC